MKITVSYINSLYDQKKTIDLINETSADAIHVDLMDGIYAGTKNFDINHLPILFKDNIKPLEIHMMVNKPSGYLNDLLKLKLKLSFTSSEWLQPYKLAIQKILQ